MVKSTVDVYIVADEVTGDFNVSYYATTKQPNTGRLIGRYSSVPEDRLHGIHEVCRSSNRRPEVDVLKQISQVLRV